MHSIKWLVVVIVAASAAIADVVGHSTLAIALGVVATIAMLGALELGAALDDDGEHGLGVARLELVLVYAWQSRLCSRSSSDSDYRLACRLAAIGLDEAVTHGPR